MARCALVYGAGMANDWALIGYLPIFIAALVRITGFGVIYNRRMLRRTVLWGLAGLSLYLLLPTVHSFSWPGAVGFWEALKGNLKLQKEALGFCAVRGSGCWRWRRCCRCWCCPSAGDPIRCNLGTTPGWECF